MYNKVEKPAAPRISVRYIHAHNNLAILIGAWRNFYYHTRSSRSFFTCEKNIKLLFCCDVRRRSYKLIWFPHNEGILSRVRSRLNEREQVCVCLCSLFLPSRLLIECKLPTRNLLIGPRRERNTLWRIRMTSQVATRPWQREVYLRVPPSFRRRRVVVVVVQEINYQVWGACRRWKLPGERGHQWRKLCM